jgi:hypothetical protein
MNLHVSLSKPMMKTTVLGLCKLIEMLKVCSEGQETGAIAPAPENAGKKNLRRRSRPYKKFFF